MADTRHLDTALDILKGNGKSRRAKGTTFTLYVNPIPEGRSRPFNATHEGILQGPRGKTVATFWDEPENIKSRAQDHVARIPGATLTIYE